LRKDRKAWLEGFVRKEDEKEDIRKYWTARILVLDDFKGVWKWL